jgi:hypothetical protein
VDQGLMLTFEEPAGSHTLVFDDCGKVAYAYLKAGGTIVGEVWLYNRCPTPAEPEWTNRTLIPFALSREYLADGGMVEDAVREDDVAVNWEYENGQVVAYVYVFGELYGVVGVGDQPGCARYACKASRLARVMEIEDGQEL